MVRLRGGRGLGWGKMGLGGPAMGRSQIGPLPTTRRWNEVVRLIADGADVEQVAAGDGRGAV